MPEKRGITQLLANQPIKELTPKTDFFNTIPKGDTIVSFINAYTESLKDNKLIALYGGWGTGKTSLIYYIRKKLESDNFTTIYFETWKYEKDDNLALSLVDVIIEKVDKRHKRVIQNFKNISFSLMKNFAKSISFQIPGVSIDANTLLSGLEDDITSQNDSMSFHQKLKIFKASYKEIENRISKKDNKRIIIFIDDLDRCEPENILNLLTALKHFFSNGEKTIFFCGIDKDAVTKAVRYKYNDIVKSEEYLEKIFDISFQMYQQSNKIKLISYYFKDYPKDLHNTIDIFFNYLGFTNPRHLKKVLNKFLIVKFIKEKSLTNHELIPKIKGENSLNIFLILYFIILLEFEQDLYTQFKSIESKRNNLIEEYYQNQLKSKQKDNARYTLYEATNELNPFLPYKGMLINNISQSNIQEFIKTINFFLPTSNNPFVISDIIGLKKFNQIPILKYIDQFVTTNNKFQIGFCKFLVEMDGFYNNSKMTDRYKIMTLFKMVETIL
ncbi:MAG: P-loop NTPase fold protein [Candidatus Tenebribacter burtonii]|nr:P-loop NTPase fold protein [Candidatus Tenebribacter burtonii]